MTRSLTVVSIVTAKSWRGGESQILALTRGLAARGHRAIVAARPDSAIGERTRDAAMETVDLFKGAALNPLSIRRVARILKRTRADIVHMHDSHAHTVGVLGSRLARVGRRIVSRRVESKGKSLNTLKYKHGVDRFVAVSHTVRDVMIEAGVAAERIAVVHDGVDPERFAGGDGALVRKELGVPANAPLVGTVAHFSGGKSLETLVRAAGRILEGVPSAYILLLGDGEQRPMLSSEREASPAKNRILMPGFRRNVGDFLAAFDLFVMPSRTEGLCSSILDAFARRVPVAATRAGGIPELVEHERSGLLCEPGRPDTLAHNVVRLLNDRELARRMSETAYAKLQSRFTHDAMVEGTLQVYREVLG